MSKPYSMDLRERVVAAVERDGLSRHEAAARFGVAPSSAIKRVQRYRATGSVAPSRMGARRSQHAGPSSTGASMGYSNAPTLMHGPHLELAAGDLTGRSKR